MLLMPLLSMEAEKHRGGILDLLLARLEFNYFTLSSDF